MVVTIAVVMQCRVRRVCTSMTIFVRGLRKATIRLPRSRRSCTAARRDPTAPKWDKPVARPVPSAILPQRRANRSIFRAPTIRIIVSMAPLSVKSFLVIRPAFLRLRRSQTRTLVSPFMSFIISVSINVIVGAVLQRSTCIC
jgi:hypothetical protein